MWSILLIYGAPTAFMVLCWLAGVLPFSWLIFLWGSAATAIALWFGETRV